MIGQKNQRRSERPVTQLLGVDHVDMREYHGHIGDIIRIDAFSLFKVDKVLVAIRDERSGFIERGLARLDAISGQWLYTASVENLEKDDWSIAITALRAPVSLRTKDEGEALTLLHSKNEAHRQPVLNLHIARTYLAATDPEMAKRTWQTP